MSWWFRILIELTTRVIDMVKNPGEVTSDDFLEQILGFPAYTGGAETYMARNNVNSSLGVVLALMMLQLSSGDCSSHLGSMGVGLGVGINIAYGGGAGCGSIWFLLGLSLDQRNGGFVKMEDVSGSGKRFRHDVFDSQAASFVKAIKFV